jgi:hypothetical protein
LNCAFALESVSRLLVIMIRLSRLFLLLGSPISSVRVTNQNES